MCERFNSLPHSGGIMDQDHLLIRKVALVHDALNERRSMKSSKKSQQDK